jgi:hypothetical protein
VPNRAVLLPGNSSTGSFRPIEGTSVYQWLARSGLCHLPTIFDYLFNFSKSTK